VSLTDWSLTSGATVDFIAGFANTAADPTFQVNSTSSKTVKNKDGAALVAGDIALGRQHTLKYDGTNWRLQDPALSLTTVRMAQALYDDLFRVGYVTFLYDDDDPNDDIPAGVTATWTEISVDDGGPRAICLYDQDAAASRLGSSTTSTSGSHDHGGSTGNNTDNANRGSGGEDTAPRTHDHSISTDGDHSHQVFLRRVVLRAWRRTA
jgi:hypothetical protein